MPTLIDIITGYKANTNRSPINIYLCTISVLSFILIVYSGAIAPITSDDWIGYSLKEDRSFTEYIRYSYNRWIGRIQGMTIGYYSIGTYEKTIFGAINGFGFIALVIMSFVLACGRWPNFFSNDRDLLLILSTILWFTLPTIGQTVFWRSGATVYLWPCFFASVFLLPYRFELCRTTDHKISKSRKFFYSFIMLLLGVWVGFSHEQIFISILSFICIFFYFFIKGGKIRESFPWLMSGLFGLLIGGVIMILAPGNFIRYSYYNDQTIIDKLLSVFSYLFAVVTSRASGEFWNAFIPWIIILLSFLFMSCVRKHNNELNLSFNKDDKKLFCYFLTTAIFALIPILILASFATARTAFFSIYFLIIAITSLSYSKYSDLQYDRQFKTVILIIVFLAINAFFLDSLITTARMWKLKSEIVTREHYIQKLRNNCQRDIPLEPILTKPGRTIFFEDISQNANNEFNMHMARYYGINSIRVVTSHEDRMR